MVTAAGWSTMGAAVWLALGLGLGFAPASPARAQGMGPGMMGGHGGMMNGYGPGMMGGQAGGPGAPAPGAAADPAWARLDAYVVSHRLSCMGCHSLQGRGAGPSFSDIARRFAGRSDGEAEMARAIRDGMSGQWTGYPPMPGGLATPGEATALARLISGLAH